MTVVMVRPKAQELQAWQYTMKDEAPMWVLDAMTLNDQNELVLNRGSGRQGVRPSEWLVKHPDQKDLIWCTDAEFKRDYEVTT